MVANNVAFAGVVMSTGSPSVRTSISSSDNLTKERPTVLVVGATGKVGRRVVRELRQVGCEVRAGGRAGGKYEQVASEENWGEETAVKEVNLDVTQDGVSDLVTAIGDADVVVSAFGSFKSFGAVDGFGIAKLARAAGESGSATQFVLVSSLGVGRPWVFPTALFNLFGGLLIFKDYSEHVLRGVSRRTGLKYTIVRPGGFEAPKDDHYLTHKSRLYPRNSLSLGTVSALQIAKLITTCILNPSESNRKTVELIAEEDAPDEDLVAQLEKISLD